jgi:hypothetical protein
MARMRVNGTKHFNDGENSIADGKGRIARMRPFPCAMPSGSGGDAINGN